MPPVMGTGKNDLQEMLPIWVMHIDGLLSRFGVLFFFAVNVLSEALMGSISLDMPGKTTTLPFFIKGD